MKTKQVYLDYLPEYNAFGVKDEVIEALTAQNITPSLSLKKEDYARLECRVPASNAPTVAFLLGREKNTYTIDFNYAKAIAQSGVKIAFLTYGENISQLQNADGLILPGGAFNSPNQFYTDPLKPTDNQPGTRSYAYITSIMEAENKKLPMLGICAGAQMIGGMHGMRMYRDVKEYTQTSLEHKTKEPEAHEVTIYPNSPLYKLLGTKNITVNSRHREAMFPVDVESDLNIYATAPDGMPEAWGNEDKNILCIQWHPEDFAANGNQNMQNIYDWIAVKARIHQKQKQIKQQKKISLFPLKAKEFEPF